MENLERPIDMHHVQRVRRALKLGHPENPEQPRRRPRERRVAHDRARFGTAGRARPFACALERMFSTSGPGTVALFRPAGAARDFRGARGRPEGPPTALDGFTAARRPSSTPTDPADANAASTTPLSHADRDTSPRAPSTRTSNSEGNRTCNTGDATTRLYYRERLYYTPYKQSRELHTKFTNAASDIRARRG